MAASQVVVLDKQPTENRGPALRGALALSLITGRPFQWSAGDPATGGLSPLEVLFIRAAQTLGDAEVAGAEAGSPRLSFSPGPIRSGNYLFDVGAAGSATHLLELLAVPLSLAGGESTLKLRGGTHLEGAPSFHDLSLAWAPLLDQLGFTVRVELEQAGFGAEPGEITARVLPHAPRPPCARIARGNLLEVQIHSLLAHGSAEVAQRQSERARRRLRESGIVATAENLPLAGRSPGSACILVATFEGTRLCFSSVGSAEASPEAVADRAVAALLRFMAGRGAADEQLAAQGVIPAAVVASGLAGSPQPGRFTTDRLTAEVVERVALVQRFLPVRAVVRGEVGGEGEVIVAPPPAIA